MASGVYTKFKQNLMAAAAGLAGDTIKVALMNNSHAFSAANSTWSDVSANEVSGTGYTAGGATLALKTVTGGKFDAADVIWTGLTTTAYHAVVYNSTTGDLIASIDFGGAKTFTVGTFRIIWNSDGIIKFS